MTKKCLAPISEEIFELSASNLSPRGGLSS
jgi:hypothetical protein